MSFLKRNCSRNPQKYYLDVTKQTLKKKKKKKKWKQLLEQVVRLITYKKLLQMKPDWQNGASYPKI